MSWWRGCEVARGGVCDAALLCNAGLWTAARLAPARLLGGGNWQPAELVKEQTKTWMVTPLHLNRISKAFAMLLFFFFLFLLSLSSSSLHPVESLTLAADKRSNIYFKKTQFIVGLKNNPKRRKTHQWCNTVNVRWGIKINKDHTVISLPCIRSSLPSPSALCLHEWQDINSSCHSRPHITDFNQSDPVCPSSDLEHTGMLN